MCGGRVRGPGSPISAEERERVAQGRRQCHRACIFPSCVDWRRKPSTSSTSRTSSTKTATPPQTMATMAPPDSELPLPPFVGFVSGGLSGGEGGGGGGEGDSGGGIGGGASKITTAVTSCRTRGADTATTRAPVLADRADRVFGIAADSQTAPQSPVARSAASTSTEDASRRRALALLLAVTSAILLPSAPAVNVSLMKHVSEGQT